MLGTNKQEHRLEELTGETQTAKVWESPAYYESSPLISDPHHAIARGFGKVWELHPGTAAFAIGSDSMCSVVDMASLGTAAPFLWPIAGLVNGVVVFMGQRKWAGDDVQDALLKSLIVGFLVALPTPFPSFLTIPPAIAGAIRMLRRKA